MNSLKRNFMTIDLKIWSQKDWNQCQTINPTDYQELGEVMYDAYLNTIDYTGETLNDAIVEIAETMNGKYGEIIAPACLKIQHEKWINAAIIFTFYKAKEMPLLTFSMTRASEKGKGYAKMLIHSALTKLAQMGYSRCCLFVTEGNEPAFSIYKKIGFEIENM